MDHDRGNEIVSDFVELVGKYPDLKIKKSFYSPNVYEIDGLFNCLLYVKARSEDPLRWGVRAKVVQNLRRQNKPWYVLLLYIKPQTGYLFPSTAVIHYIDNKVWPIGKDGDYKPAATRLYSDKSIHIHTLEELLKQIHLSHQSKFSVESAIAEAIQETNILRKRGEGESESHKKLKLFVHDRPDLINLSDVMNKWIEYSFPSGDRVDVAFESKNNKWTVVEIELEGVPQTIIGLFQVVKYMALQKAVLKIKGIQGEVEGILVARTISPEVKMLANILLIRTVELVPF
ncbi:MAG: hypothetical protein ABR936_17080 [Bacteroidota bacterium]|jgi:hypothetical protein